MCHPTKLATLLLYVGALAVGLLISPSARAQPQWTFHGAVAEGGQLDAVRGPDDRVHVVTSEYVELDATGSVLLTEPVGDGQQGNLDFPPAIAVASDQSVHIVTRHDGSWTDGHDIRYRRRNDSGSWDRDYLVGSRVKRNYVVGIAAPAPDQIYLHYTQAGSNVWGDIHLWQAGASSAQLVGSISGIWRGDTDARLRARAGRVVLVSGKCDPDGTAYALFGAAGASLRDELVANQNEHQAGSGRRAFADQYVDGGGDAHFTYGAMHEVYYNRYSPQGQAALASDVRVFDGLGDWHMSTGLSAVAASDDGQVVVVVALRSDGSQQAADSDLLFAYSIDAGQSWSTPVDLERNTHGGEGRHRPRLVAVGNTFLLLYGENGVSGISLATVQIVVDADHDGYPAGEDCNDEDPNVHPDAEELCNGIDDDCDDETDEGCPCESGAQQPCGSDVGECQPGVQTCAAEQWGPCEGAVEPTREICDGLDNDCDGETDEQCVDGSGGATGSSDSDDGGGCGCRAARSNPRDARLASMIFVVIAMLLRRRRRVGRRSRSGRC